MGFLALGGLALLFMFAGSGGESSGQSDTCRGTPHQARSRGLQQLLGWVICDGRTAVEVAQLAVLLRQDGRHGDAASIEAAWNARLELDATPGDGTLDNPEDDTRAVDVLLDESPAPPMQREPDTRGTFTLGDVVRTDEPENIGAPAGWNEREARRLAPQVARSLRSGGGYRSALMRFQTAAGLIADGLYGPTSRAALRHFGVSTPPAALVDRGGAERYEPYTVAA